MPAYNKSPFAAAIRLLVPGVAEYFFGSWPQDVSPTLMYVQSVAIAANVATLGVTVYGGNAPAVGSLISTQGLANAQFNVLNATLTNVTLNSAGVGTVTFALAAGNVNTTVDAGVAMVPQPVQTEALVNGASIPVAMGNNSFGGDLTGSVSVQALFGSLPTAVSIQLQGSNVNTDSAFVTLGTICTVAGSAVTANGLTVNTQYLFYRALVSGLNGAGTAAVQIEA